MGKEWVESLSSFILFFFYSPTNDEQWKKLEDEWALKKQ